MGFSIGIFPLAIAKIKTIKNTPIKIENLKFFINILKKVANIITRNKVRFAQSIAIIVVVMKNTINK